MKILCATDFSARARAAAKVAIDLVRRTGGAVELVHVVIEPNAVVRRARHPVLVVPTGPVHGSSDTEEKGTP
jgi:hypothetical protein